MGLQGHPLSDSEGFFGNGAGGFFFFFLFSRIPVHLPTCSRLGGHQESSGALYPHRSVRPSGPDRTGLNWTRPRSTPSAPIKGTQRREARATVRGPVTDEAAKALRFIWICLGLFVCSPVFTLADWQRDNPFPGYTYSRQVVDSR